MEREVREGYYYCLDYSRDISIRKIFQEDEICKQYMSQTPGIQKFSWLFLIKEVSVFIIATFFLKT